MAIKALPEQKRKQLDGIVQQMIQNKEPDSNIRFVVDDFKNKYSVEHQPVEVLKAEQKAAEKEANIGLGKRFFKELPGAATDVVLGSPARLATSLAEGINTTIKTGGKTSASGKTYDLPLLKPFESFQSEADRKAKEGVSPMNNILSTGGKTVVAGLDTIGLTEGAMKAAPLVKQGISSARKGASALNNARNNTKIWNLIQPKLNSAEMADAVKSGQIVKSGLTRKITQVPNQEMVDVARQYLKTTDPIKATSQMQKGIETEANAIRAGLKQSKAIWNKNELIGAINKVEKPHLLSGDVEKAFNKTLEAALKQGDRKSVV